MRLLPPDEHQLRKEKVLQAAIHLFIRTGKPVGSSAIVENFQFNLSPATIRNVLADLEKEGFLTHPHTSAGRVPTDRGYRVYVDSIAKIQRLAQEEEQRIRKEYFRKMREINDLMRSTTRVLSALSRCTGFALHPSIEGERIRRVELIPVGSNQILGVLVSESGLVHNQRIAVDRIPEDRELRFASQFLSERLAGLSFVEAQARFVNELKDQELRHMARRQLMEELSRHLFDQGEAADLYVEGASNLLKFPEFQDYESMRNFAELMDEKKTLVHVLNSELSRKGLNVRIGGESSPELKNFSVVSTSYSVNGHPVGVLGILGPKRMEYERMMAIVTTVAGLVNRILEGDDPKLLEQQGEL